MTGGFLTEMLPERNIKYLNLMMKKTRTRYFIKPDGSRKKASSIQIRVTKNRSLSKSLLSLTPSSIKISSGIYVRDRLSEQ